MSNNPEPDSESPDIGNQSSSIQRRDSHELRDTRPHATIGNGPKYTVGMNRSYNSSSFDFESMLTSLRELFEQDRQVASQGDSTRCGLCYLFFKVSDLTYREDGYYICSNCEQNLGPQNLPMLRKQQK